jgi:hypothetical protein
MPLEILKKSELKIKWSELKIIPAKMNKILITTAVILLLASNDAVKAQLKWVNVDADFAPLPSGVHVYKTNDSLDGKPNIAFYVAAELKNKQLNFTDDTTYKRRFTPKQFYNKNNQPLVVVNCTFFNFDKNQNLNTVVKDGKLVAYNIHSVPMKGIDTFQYRHPLGSAIGIDKKGNADVAWLYTDSLSKYPFAQQSPYHNIKDSSNKFGYSKISKNTISLPGEFNRKHWEKVPLLKKWKMKTAVGGGPVLVQDGAIKITNNEELKFTGKAIEDKHPRTCMGYTKDGKLIIMVIQGRFPGIAEGATLTQEAKLLIDLGCVEALNLDGGGSSCMLVNGKETIKPSDKEGERAVPAVFLISFNK